MEPRTQDLKNEAKDMGREAKEIATEKMGEWSNKTRAAASAAMESARAAYQVAQSKTLSGAKATDEAIRTNPYSALGIAFGAGLLLGFLIKQK